MLSAIKDVYNYRIVRKIADGGMGSVYEAIQDGVDGYQKVVALKTLLPNLCENTRFISMFVQEAKLVANLVHENIVQIYQLGKIPEGYYIVMEYVHGLSLHEFIRFHNTVRREPPPVELSVFIASRIARGLAYAHGRTDNHNEPLDIVHRDVCPNNIMITTEGLPKLADFGIAIVSSETLTGTQQLMGKLTYMSPQQARREPVDFHADIFSLGTCFFELLSGRRPRGGDSEEEIIERAREGFIDWERLPAQLPQDVREILERCLAFDPSERFSTTAELAKSLEYVIYKDGYGPTIQSLESYLRSQLPYLYNVKPRAGGAPSIAKRAHEQPRSITATLIIDDTKKKCQ